MTFTSYNKARMYIYKGDSATSDPLGNHRIIDYSASPPSAATYDADYYIMQYFVALQNPDTSSSLTYDGIQGRVNYKVYNDGGSNYTAQCRWEDTNTPPTFDMKPQTAHNSDSTE